MRATTQDTYGAPIDVLRLDDVAPPRPAAHEVLVRVAAAGVDRGVVHLVTGLPYPVRLVTGPRRPRATVPGADVAGVVEAVGADVTRFRPGDAVFGVARGAFAELAVAPEAKLAATPAGLSPVEAAAVPISATTALQAVRDHGRVAAGDRVLVLGAAGGVGSYAVQLARARGASVTGVCRTDKVDLVRQLGVDRVVDHLREDPTAGDERYDVIIDTGGHTPLRRLRRVLTPRGRLVIVGSETGGRWLGGLDRQLRAAVLSRFVGQQLGTFLAREDAADLEALRAPLETGELRPVIDRTFPLAQAAAAVDHVAQGRARGKVVVTVA